MLIFHYLGCAMVVGENFPWDNLYTFKNNSTNVSPAKTSSAESLKGLYRAKWTGSFTSMLSICTGIRFWKQCEQLNADPHNNYNLQKCLEVIPLFQDPWKVKYIILEYG